MSEFVKVGAPGERLLRWLQDPANAAECDRRSAEYDRLKTGREERERAHSETLHEQRRGLPPAALHPNSIPRLWPHPGERIEGPVGTGKTRLAREYALSVPREACIFIEALEFFDLARRIDVGEASEFDHERWNALYARRYLILDDFGARRHTQAAENYALHLMNARQDLTRFCTILTSNLTLPEIAAEWGNAIASRIKTFGPPHTITGSDRRGRVQSLGATFLRFTPRARDSEAVTQSEILEDVAPGRPRNGEKS